MRSEFIKEKCFNNFLCNRLILLHTSRFGAISLCIHFQSSIDNLLCNLWMTGELTKNSEKKRHISWLSLRIEDQFNPSLKFIKKCFTTSCTQIMWNPSIFDSNIIIQLIQNISKFYTLHSFTFRPKYCVKKLQMASSWNLYCYTNFYKAKIIISYLGHFC